MIELTKENFEEEVCNGQVVLLDFWATWCGPCKMMSPVLDELAEKYEDKIKFCKVNIEDVPTSEIPSQFSVSAVPTLMTVKNGQIVSKEVGLKSKEVIEEMIEGAIL